MRFLLRPFVDACLAILIAIMGLTLRFTLLQVVQKQRAGRPGFDDPPEMPARRPKFLPRWHGRK